MLAVIVLLPLGRGSEAAVAVGAVAGIVLIARRRIDLRAPAARRVLVLFACYWMAALLSAVAAVEPARTWSTVADTLRFLPFALFTVWALRRVQTWPMLVRVVGVIVALWALDAYVQMATGYSLGGPAEKERVSGIFGAGNLKLGPVLATLAPFALVAARERFGGRGLALAFIVLAVPILLAGSRAAWLSYALAGALFAWQQTRDARRFLALSGALAVIVAAIGAFAWHDSARFGARIERSLLALHGTQAAVDEASAGRLSIWHTALAMSAAHPLTGVGVRGFRYAYPRYAAPGDRFVDTTTDIGASHAHQIVLEVLSETGVIGLAFWLAGAWFAWDAWRRASAIVRERALAPALALAVMTFPLNTHLAFYSAWWGLLFWWLLALYCAALQEPADA
ncbi:MAG: O-antigen ligase family protein [Rhodanobacter sp.]|nr:O-antigen ligase family protein [Rhodanobacter sp.]